MLRDIVVYLDGSVEDKVRLAHGESIAQRFDAHVTGLYVNALPGVIATGTGVGTGDLAIQMQNQAVARGDEFARVLKTQVAALGSRSDFRRFDAYPGQAGRVIAQEARTADLTVMTRLYGHENDKDAALLERGLFDSGRGVILVPPDSTPPPDWSRIMIAWNGSRESARAVSEAMPFIEAADRVTITLIDERSSAEEAGQEPGADIARHLSRHDAVVEIQHIAEWHGVHEALLNQAEKSGASLLVMGAYGHSRLREWVLGGVTRGVLSEAKLPVLVAH